MKAPSRKPSVKLVHGQATTTSIKIAEAFGKRHDTVLRVIRELECTPEFAARNFAEGEYTDANNQKRPMYTITRDGFTFLACGFTGKEAAQWKEKYIEAFNALEKAALEKAEAKRLPQAQKALPKARYYYPRSLLDQPYFTSPQTGRATLTLAMLADTRQFVSPLLALLNQLRSEGHDITAPFDEAVAMRTALQQVDKDMQSIGEQALKARFKNAETR